MAKKQKDYFGLSGLVSLILAIIPITALICGVITRWKDGCKVAAILRLLLGWNVIYVLDLICMIFSRRIFRILAV